MGTQNVETLTGRSRELSGLLKIKKANICLFQETQLKVNKAKEKGDYLI